MLAYGIACWAVVVLSLPDRRAFPFALVIVTGWTVAAIQGHFMPETAWKFWPAISAASSVALFYLWKKNRERWALAVAAIAGAMLMMDGVHLWARGNALQIQVEYSRALDVMLLGQLALILFGGHRGRVGLVHRLFQRVGRTRLVPVSRESSEGAG